MNEANKTRLYQFVEQMLKVELHVHLEGSVPQDVLVACAQKNNRPLPPPMPLKIRPFFRDFQQFVELYFARIRCLATPEDYESIIFDFGKQCANQQIRYVETTFTLVLNSTLSGLPWQVIFEAAENARNRVSRELGVQIRWICDIVRDEADGQKDIIEEALRRYYPDSIAGVGLAGDEKIDATSLVPLFTKLHQRGIPTAIHAGETSGAPTIWYALEHLYAKRIGHGVSSISDPELIAYIKSHHIPIETCPTSNVQMGSVISYEAHPLRKWWDDGIFLTLGSDDPALFHTNLVDEYKILIDKFGFTLDEIMRMNLNGVAASFLTSPEKEKLTQSFTQEMNVLKKNLFV